MESPCGEVAYIVVYFIAAAVELAASLLTLERSPTMSTEQKSPELESEDSILAETHVHRKKIFQKITTAENGEFRLPEDPAMVKAAISVLKDMDTAALGRKRIKVEEKAADLQGAASGIIAQVLQAAAAQKGLYRTDQPVAREVPALGSEVPTPPMVEGETAVVGGASETYETFLARQQGGNASAAT
jgi:fructose-specific component phosphotransferase system IIB-like protein